MTEEEEQTSKGKTLADGLSIRVSEETTGKVADGILDIFSPLIQGMGIVGDHLRFHREKVVIKAGRRVTELIGPDEDINPVPPKLFVPWLESVSLEDLDDDTMIDAWASVLARASIDFNPQMPSYLKVLEQMMPAHADLLKDVVLKNDVKGDDMDDDLSQSVISDRNSLKVYAENVRVRCAGGQDLDESLAASQDFFFRRGTLLFHAVFEPGTEKVRSNCGYMQPKSVEAGGLFPVLAVLQNLGLIHTYYEGFRDENGKGRLFVILATITDYGQQFSQTCIPEVVEAMKVESI